jgi:limonene-1,2-epoxide hydrolase
MEAKFIVTAFVDAINTRDIEALGKLMPTDTLMQNQPVSPLLDYRIHVERIISDCQSVVLVGNAISCHGTVPAVWIAQLCGQRIMDWQVYFDGQITCTN